MKKILLITGLVTLGLVFQRCEPEQVVVSARYNRPAYERPPRPYPDYIWIEGDWYWDNGDYRYHDGYWAPPRRHRQWHSGTWIQVNGGWTWRRGSWH